VTCNRKAGANGSTNERAVGFGGNFVERCKLLEESGIDRCGERALEPANASAEGPAPGKKLSQKESPGGERHGTIGTYGRGRVSLKRARLAEDEALATGEGDFRTVLEHKDIAHQVDDACMLDVLEVDDAITAGAEELGRVEPLFAIAKRTTDQHRRADPIDAAVISLGLQAEQVGHPKDATFDVVGENDEIVISKRDVPSQLVNDLPGFSGGTIGLIERRKASSVL
jgi:hypothetical protein